MAMKWMDRSSATEMDKKVPVKWIDRQSATKIEMPLK